MPRAVFWLAFGAFCRLSDCAKNEEVESGREKRNRMQNVIVTFSHFSCASGSYMQSSESQKDGRSDDPPIDISYIGVRE
jgi:hypothetical protein